MEADDFRRWTTDYYAGTVARLHLWDISRADLTKITVDTIEYQTFRTFEDGQGMAGGLWSTSTMSKPKIP